jgi:hypothetical protein
MYKLSVISLFSIFSAAILFHLVVFAGFIPYKIVWGGRLETLSDMYMFEIISIVVNSVFLLIVSAKSGIVKLPLSDKNINIAIWIMAVVFIVNTVGNLFSLNDFERTVFAPLTFFSALFCIILARKQEAL